ncbi:UNVERIFIED_CONTAM: hypothetical protein Sindi_3102200, partial [Sesamum indicum]
GFFPSLSSIINKIDLSLPSTLASDHCRRPTSVPAARRRPTPSFSHHPRARTRVFRLQHKPPFSTNLLNFSPSVTVAGDQRRHWSPLTPTTLFRPSPGFLHRSSAGLQRLHFFAPFPFLHWTLRLRPVGVRFLDPLARLLVSGMILRAGVGSGYQ